MKVGFQVEGPIDRMVLLAFVNAILERDIDPVFYEKRAGGLTEVLRTLEKCLWKFWADACAGAVIVVDANGTTPHDSHPAELAADCRYCHLRARLPALPDGGTAQKTKYAVAVPVQAIEAWLLHFGHHVNRRPSGPPQSLDRREAKRLLWGDVAPSHAQFDEVWEKILPNLNRDELERLAAAQPSFRAFQAEVRAFA